MSDTTDDLDYGIDLWDDEGRGDKREKDWKKGVHTTKTGTKIKIRDMETLHLENTIKHFDHLDTKPLQAELKRRSL